MNYITKGAEDIMNAFYNTFAENREDFVIREIDKNAIAAVLRACEEQLMYVDYDCRLFPEHILSIANELEQTQ
jgi:hypothetical protein